MAAERKGKKLRRCGKFKGYYSLQVSRSEVNKKRTLRNHIRRLPADLQAIARYEKDMGKVNFI